MSNDDKFYGGLRVGAAGSGGGASNIVEPPRTGMIFARVANGASATICPAPPAGYMNLATFAGHNADAALTLLFRAHDADGDHVANGAAPIAALGDAFPVNSGFPLLLTTDLVAVVSGGTGGTPCEFRGNYQQVPIPTGIMRAAVVLTTAYQAIPIVPASGQMVGLSLIPDLQSGNQGILIFNGDTATATVNFRLTRGATIFLWNTTVSGPPIRSAPFPVVPILPGDVFEVKLAAPPAVPGTIIFRANYVPATLAQ